MQLQIESHHKNSAPLQGLFIKGQAPRAWLQAAEPLAYPLAQLRFHPLPGKHPNSLWGCLLVLPRPLETPISMPYPAAQWVEQQLFIPEFTRLRPALAVGELTRLLGSGQYCLHPSLGFIQLEPALNWAEMLDLPFEHVAACRRPANSIQLPSKIKGFEVQAVEPELMIQMLEELVDQNSENAPKEGPLSAIEKIRLEFYKNLFKDENDHNEAPKTGLMKGLGALGRLFSGKKPGWPEQWKKDFEQLQQRNQKTLEHLLKMLKENPEEALKYALPLNHNNTGSTSSSPGALELSKIWEDFSLFNNKAGSSRGGESKGISENAFLQLWEQYKKTAEELRQKGAYKKAAFVYLKLLKDYQRAAEVLEEGHYYKEAAAIYLKYLKNKEKAAAAYVKANAISKAIELYLELGQHEKAGDLYMRLHKEEEAMQQYKLVVMNCLQYNQYLKASFVYEQKMQLPDSAQRVRLNGWKQNYDAYNCLNNYFNAFDDAEELMPAILDIYQQHCKTYQYRTFIHLLKLEFGKWQVLQAPIRRLVYEIVAENAKEQPELVQQLQYFKPEDKQLIKDLWRFKSGKQLDLD